MSIIRPFRAVRPRADIVEKVASLPYDVMNVEEAKAMALGNPFSFLHVSRPEIDLSSEVNPYDSSVYEKGRENLQKLVSEGVLLQDETPMYYVYRQRMGRFEQTGLVACSSVDDYQSGVIKKHELTRADKEEDRIRHIDALSAHDEPVFYTYRSNSEVTELLHAVTVSKPVYDFTTEDGVSHTLLIVSDNQLIGRFTELFAAIPALYVADGHHRSAAASILRDRRKEADANPDPSSEYNYFLTVIFPDCEMNIMPYNRAVDDLNGLTIAEFISRISAKFDIIPVSLKVEPASKHKFGMYCAGSWYELTPKPGTFNDSDPVEQLDVSILQNNLLSPVLAVRNPRTDSRIHFIGGIRGVDELQRLVDSKKCAVAFSLFPTTMDDLMALADADMIMPPKSTWFEPKLRSGLFLHLF